MDCWGGCLRHGRFILQLRGTKSLGMTRSGISLRDGGLKAISEEYANVEITGRSFYKCL